MPELPDIAAYVEALFLLRTADPPVAEAEGLARALRRIGKRIAIGLDNDLWLVLHLVIAGRLHWEAACATPGGRNRLAAFDFSEGSLDGIGNAYSDEILHAARLSPIALTQKLRPPEWERLYDATRRTLHLWVDRLSARARQEVSEHVTAFRPGMAVHGRYGKPCPDCGEKIQRIRYADNETNYCVRCQTGGKLLADRGLSRLLGADWPRTLEELEALRQ